jgi:Mor family transcriptional regulator
MDEFDDDDIIELPDDALPDIEELAGDLRLLAEIVGVKLALLVAQRLGGTPLRIATGRKWVLRRRNKMMRAEYDRGGITVVDLARKYRVGERQAYNILGSPDDTPPARQYKLW